MRASWSMISPAAQPMSRCAEIRRRRVRSERRVGGGLVVAMLAVGFVLAVGLRRFCVGWTFSGIWSGALRPDCRSLSRIVACSAADSDEKVTWLTLSQKVRNSFRGEPTPWPEYVKSATNATATMQSHEPSPSAGASEASPDVPTSAPVAQGEETSSSLPAPVEAPAVPAPDPVVEPPTEEFENSIEPAVEEIVREAAAIPMVNVAPAPAPASVEEPHSGMKVWQLRELAQARGLQSTGSKTELLERLRAPVAPESAPDSAPEIDQPAAQTATPPAAPSDTAAQGNADGITSMAQLQVGQKLRGTVKKLYKFGALVDVGVERPGMMRGTRMARDKHIEDVELVLSEGQEIDVWVYRVPPNGKLGLCGVEWSQSRRKDPLAAFERCDRSKWFDATVRFHSPQDSGFYVDIAAPDGDGVVQGFLHSRVSDGASVGSVIKVRVLRAVIESGTLDVSAMPVPTAR